MLRSDCSAFWLFMDSNRRHLKRTMKLLIFVMGHLLNCFVQQLHNSIYVISFYFQQQLIMSHWLLVLISRVPWPSKVTFAGTSARKVVEISSFSPNLPIPSGSGKWEIGRGWLLWWREEEGVGQILISETF